LGFFFYKKSCLSVLSAQILEFFIIKSGFFIPEEILLARFGFFIESE